MRSAPRDALVTVTLAVGAGIVAAASAATIFFSSSEPYTLRGDNLGLMYPMTRAAYASWLDGHVPGWLGVWSGHALLAEPPSAALYLPHALAFAATPPPHLRAYDIATALHAGWVVAGSVYLLRIVGAAPAAALFGGLLTFLCPFLQRLALWGLPHFVALSWWPWLFVASERLATRAPGRAGGALLFGPVTLAAQVLAGYPEFAVYGGLIAVGWTLVPRSNGNGPAALVRLWRVMVLGGGAMLLTAPLLLPALFLLRDSTWDVRYSGIALELTAHSVLMPAGVGRMPDHVFLGSSVLVLAMLALATRARRALLLAVVALVALVAAHGDATPFGAILRSVQPFSHFRNPAKIFVATHLAVIWLAALGLSALVRGSTPCRPTSCVVAALLALGALAERGIATVRFPVHVPPKVPVTVALEELTSLGLSERNVHGPTRTLFDLYFKNLPTVLGLETVTGGPHPLLPPKQMPGLLSPKAPGQSPKALDQAGGQYVVANRKYCENVARRFELQPVSRTEHFCLLRSARFPKRYLLALGGVAVDSSDAMADPLSRLPTTTPPVVDPRRDLAVHLRQMPGRHTVRVLAYRPGHVRLRTVATVPRLLLVRESLVRGWYAQVDGKRTPIYPAAGIYFGVPVPAGTHEVELRYEPPGFRVGLVLAGGTLMVLLTLATTGRIHRPIPRS